jgi:conjugal transfer/entry exclusion protein
MIGTSKWTKKAIISVASLALAIALASRSATAQFSVFDPANFGEAIVEAGYDLSNVNQAIQSYQQMLNQYNQWQQAFRTLTNMAQRYQNLWSSWQSLQNVANLYGNTQGWVTGANTGNGAAAGYQGMTTEFLKYPQSWTSLLTPSALSRLTSLAGGVAVRDGSNVAALTTIGQVRNDSSGIMTSVSNLQNDAFASDPLNSSLVPVAQKGAAAGVLGVQAQEDSNKLLELMLENQMLASKTQRDQMSNAVASDISQKTNLGTVTTNSNDGLAAALASWQIE